MPYQLASKETVSSCLRGINKKYYAEDKNNQQ